MQTIGALMVTVAGFVIIPSICEAQVVVVGTPRGGGTIGIEVSNGGSASVGLWSAVTVERETASGWVSMDAEIGMLDLQADCSLNPPLPASAACLTLAAGGTLTPGAWLGTVGDAQCGCDECGHAPAGHYRFVVETCGHDQRFESEPFSVGPDLRVTAVFDPTSNLRSLLVENLGSAPVSVNPVVDVEVESESGSWEKVEDILFRESCDEWPTECVTVEAGARVTVPPWLETLGDAQCACERCVPIPLGTYRFTVEPCSGGHAVSTEPFMAGPADATY